MQIEDMKRLVESEVDRIIDLEQRRRLLELLTQPELVSLGWNYGYDGQRFDCWKVGQSDSGETWLVYCEEGFGLGFPWGYAYSHSDSMGMDAQWHSGLIHAAIGCGLISAPDGYEVPGPREEHS